MNCPRGFNRCTHSTQCQHYVKAHHFYDYKGPYYQEGCDYDWPYFAPIPAEPAPVTAGIDFPAPAEISAVRGQLSSLQSGLADATGQLAGMKKYTEKNAPVEEAKGDDFDKMW